MHKEGTIKTHSKLRTVQLFCYWRNIHGYWYSYMTNEKYYRFFFFKAKRYRRPRSCPLRKVPFFSKEYFLGTCRNCWDPFACLHSVYSMFKIGREGHIIFFIVVQEMLLLMKNKPEPSENIACRLIIN